MLTSKDSTNYVVGLMSGTSLDGIDVALIKVFEESDKIDVKLIHFLSLPFSDEIKERLFNLCIPEKALITDISLMNMYLGELFATASFKVIQEAGLSTSDILLISSHGQTIFHQPDPVEINGTAITSTLQIGDIGVIAERTGITTIGDFRTRDMAAGGQGAPLVPYADYMLFKEKAIGRVLVNIGGIANITILSKNCSASDVIAYDTGPGNMIIDAFTQWTTNNQQTYDKDGLLAANGKVNQSWLKKLLAHDYFRKMPPKSTGREMFGLDYAKQLWDEGEKLQIEELDKIATVTDFTAQTIAMEINRHKESKELTEVLISGGGRHNKTLMKQITHYLSKELNVIGTEEYGMPADAKEAIVFAVLGYQCYHKRTNNLPSATGAKNKAIMGKIAW